MMQNRYKLEVFSLQELGQRQNQEDSIFPPVGRQTSEDRLFILCDGMGGHERGEVASAAVCEAMSRYVLDHCEPYGLFSDDDFAQALNTAYEALDTKDDGSSRKMGTTMTFLKFHAAGATVAHIGDSRVYQLRPSQGEEPARIVFKTQDHSLVNDLIKVGELTEEEAKTFPQRNVITRAMQPHQERRAKADIAHLTDIRPGDYFFLCSDGMLEITEDENLLYIITNTTNSDREKLEMLRRVTAENQDNHTALLIHVLATNASLSDSSRRNEHAGIPAVAEDNCLLERICLNHVISTRDRRILFLFLLLFCIAILYLLATCHKSTTDNPNYHTIIVTEK